MKQYSWGIVGGGMMGMTLALRLAQQGHKVSLFEAAPALGGLTSPWEIHNFTWDKFYHVVLLSDEHTRTILKELDLDKAVNWVETKTGFYTDGKLYSMSDTVEFLSFPPLGLIDKFRLGVTIFVASRIRNWKRLENIPVEKWLRAWSGKKTFEKIWLPLLRAKLGDHYKETSAAFIWATIQRMYAARRSGLKKEMFGYVQGGYANVISTFEKKLIAEGVEINTNSTVYSIHSGKLSKPEITFENGEPATFDKVIITLPSGVSGKLCPSLSSSELALLNNIHYLGVICLSVVLKKSLSKFYVTNITDTWVPFTGVIEMSALVDKQNFADHALIYLPKYAHPSDPIFNESDEQIKASFGDALKKMYGLSDDDILYMGVARAKNVFALSTLQYSTRLPEVKTTLPGVYILNAAHITNGTLNVNETIHIAESKLSQILDEHE